MQLAKASLKNWESDTEPGVIASTRHRFARGADLSPVDLVLGWGVMSDNKVLQQINFSQGWLGRARLHMVDQDISGLTTGDRDP